jgi:hypothetical protein
VSNTIYTDAQATDNGSTEQNSRDSSLLRLPGELRNKIYEYVLSEGEYPTRVPTLEPERCRILLATSILHRLAILCVCLWDLLIVRDLLTFTQRRAITDMKITTVAGLTTFVLDDLKDLHGRNHRNLSAYLPGAQDVKITYQMPLTSTIFGGSESFEEEEIELRNWLKGNDGAVNVVLKYGYKRR